jgi:hypothetical protein
LAQKNNGTFAIKPGFFRQSLLPYLKDRNAFRSPWDAPGTVSYRFNENLCGRQLTEIRAPDNVILIYEGNKQRLKFRYRAGRR